MSKRNWYVAVGDMSGEYAGNPLSFDASQIYGPYTEEQAIAMAKLGNDFPHESKDVVAFPAQRMPIRELKKLIKAEIKEAKEDDDNNQAEHREFRRIADGDLNR